MKSPPMKKNSNLINRMVNLALLINFLTASFFTSAQSYRNASDVVHPEPFAGLTELATSKELYMIWAQDNLFKNQIVDYLPTEQVAASLLPGNIKDVFAPSQVSQGLTMNETTRIATVAADMDDDGIDEIVRLTSTSSGDLLLSVTAVGSALEVTGSSITTQISAQVHFGIKSQIKLFAGNFDADVGSEIVAIWPEGSDVDASDLEVRIFDLVNGNLELISSSTLEPSFALYDAAVSDLDIDGIPEIIIAGLQTGTPRIEVRVFNFTQGELQEKISTQVEQFSDAFDLRPDLSLAMTVGDFDADVAPEIALFIRQPNSDLSGYRVALKVLQTVDDNAVSGESLFEKLIFLQDKMLVDTLWPGLLVPYQPIYSTAGDLDGDGDDEPVLLVPPGDRIIYVNIQDEQIVSNLNTLESDFSDPFICFTRGGIQPVNLQIGDLNRDGKSELVYTFAEGCTEDIFSDNMVVPVLPVMCTRFQTVQRFL